jgi:hypothetical protein
MMRTTPWYGSVQDLCPGCGAGSFGQANWGNTLGHVDMYNSGNSCSVGGDYGNLFGIRLR